MIKELIGVADSWSDGPLSGQEPYRRRPVHWFIDLDGEGNVLGFSPTVGSEKKKPKRFALPANYRLGSPNQHNWLPDFLSGPANEIFPQGVSGTNPSAGKQSKWRELVLEAVKSVPENETIKSLGAFVECTPAFSELPMPDLNNGDKNRVLQEFNKSGAGELTLSFRVNGQLVFRDSCLKSWWEEKFRQQRDEIVKNLRSGEDMFLQGSGPLTESSPTVFGNVPFASFYKAPFKSYGLEEQTATFRLETVEKAASALNALQTNPSTKLQLGDETAVFWAVEKSSKQQISADFMQLLDQPDTLVVRDYLTGIWGAHLPEIEEVDFHVAILLKGTGRFSVRSWHTDTLGNADRHVKRYFNAINLPEIAEGITLGKMAWATIAKTKKQRTKPASATYNALFETAWRGIPLPFDLLAATIERQRVELAAGDHKTKDFRSRLAARTALIQLYFALKPDNPFDTCTGVIMNTKDTAILCGRLLALLDEIHNKAHDGKSASSPANRLYGAASATPALVFPRLCELVRYHLQKMDSGLAHKLEFGVPKERRDDNMQEDFEGLADVVARLKEASGGDFPRMLSLEDQGRFALGFYYERTRQWPNYKGKTN